MEKLERNATMQAKVATAGPRPKTRANCEAPNAESAERTAVPQTRITRVIKSPHSLLIGFTAHAVK
jgi:hypothetical protein